MKPIKIKIEKLGAIRDSEFEIARLMIFSGESGLGKSYASFLAHYLYLLLSNDRLYRFFEQPKYSFKTLLDKQKEGKEKVSLKIDKQELLDWINKDAIDYIRYVLGHDTFDGSVKIELPITDDMLTFFCEEEIMGLENKEEVFYKISLGDLLYRIPVSSSDLYVNSLAILLKFKISNILFNEARFKTFLMPPSRGALVELTSRPAFRSGMYEEFFDDKEDIDRPLKDSSYKIPESLSKCLSDTNLGNVQRVEGQLVYQTTGGDSMPITAAASSIKELAPLTMFFQKYSPKGASILFEEPEAHLHPARQIKVADLIGCAIGLGCHMQITTHSDYFLKRINNLIQLFSLKQTDEQKFKEICLQFGINQESIIDPTNVKAYVFQQREDGSTEIVSQTIDEDGIPFTSFYNVIDNDLESSYRIKKAIEKDEEE